MNKSPIEWTDFTHNTVIGCTHGCPYCYAERQNNRFHYIPKWNEPKFFPEKLNFKVPKLPKVRNRIAKQLSPDSPIVFMNSMWDCMGHEYSTKGQPTIWLERTVWKCNHCDDAYFYFVSKRMSRIVELMNDEYIDTPFWRSNIKFGWTITKINSDLENVEILGTANYLKRNEIHIFANIEPLHGSFEGVDLSPFEFVIVGAETGNRKDKVEAQIEWIRSIKHDRVYYKDSILEIPLIKKNTIRNKRGIIHLEYSTTEIALYATDMRGVISYIMDFQTRKQAVKYVIDNYSEILIEELLHGEIG